MKKIALSLTALAVVFAVTFTSCKKDDAGAPVVSIVGNGTMELTLGTTFVDPGATATDEQDGKITPVVTGTVNTDKVAEYTITYTATDEAGNVGTATRTVKVNAEKLAGSYTANETYSNGETPSSYNQVVILSSTGYNKLVFNKFGDFNGANVDITVTANGFTGADKTIQLPVGTPVYNVKIYNISGTYEKNGTLYNIKSATYKVDTTPIAGGAPETVTITQSYTRQ